MWEDKFTSWSSPPGETEQEKQDNAERAIRKAIAASDTLSTKSIRVFPQGSFRNRTNISTESDVDICVLCTDTFFYDLPDGVAASQVGITPEYYSHSTFKNDVHAALISYFPSGTVSRGNKAFDIHENTYRIDADAIPCFEYRRYAADGSYITGTAFNTDNGNRIINWPEQNYANGVFKNTENGRRFKAVVRILKNLRHEMADNGYKKADPIPSFLCECLVWNVPTDGFGHTTYTEDVRYSLAYLFNNTINHTDCSEWGEINELKYLFGTHQSWTLLQVHDFISAAWDYIGFE